MCYVATFQQSVAEKKRQLNSSSSVLTEKMPGQADDPWVFAPQSSGIGQRNFIQSLGSIGPMGGFKRIWCLGIFGWRKNGGIFDNFQGFFLVWDHCQHWELAQRLWFYSQIVAQKASPLYSKSMLKSLKILKMTFVKTMCFSCVKRVFNSDGRVLQAIRWRQTREESPKMCCKSGLEFLQRKTLNIDLIVVYAVIHPCML